MAEVQLKPEERLAQLIKSGASLVGHTDFAKIMGCKANTVRVWAVRGSGPNLPKIVIQDRTPREIEYYRKGSKWVGD